MIDRILEKLLVTRWCDRSRERPIVVSRTMLSIEWMTRALEIEMEMMIDQMTACSTSKNRQRKYNLPGSCRVFHRIKTIRCSR